MPKINNPGNGSTKASASKVKKASKPRPIKYEDKSGGQPELVIIFDAIKALLKPYEKGSLRSRQEQGGMYLLVSEKAIEVEGRKREEIYFAGIMVQKGYVGFYYMPLYADQKSGEVIKPELLKCLKGKACFHIKKNDAQLLKQIDHALKVGYEGYQKRGWLD